MKHKHAEFIIAWANGEEVEYQVNAKEGCKPIPSEWKPIFKGWSWDADFSIRYRIKPEPKPDVVYYANFRKDLISVYHIEKLRNDNLRLTFCAETGELKSAEVL